MMMVVMRVVWKGRDGMVWMVGREQKGSHYWKIVCRWEGHSCLGAEKMTKQVQEGREEAAGKE